MRRVAWTVLLQSGPGADQIGNRAHLPHVSSGPRLVASAGDATRKPPSRSSVQRRTRGAPTFFAATSLAWWKALVNAMLSASQYWVKSRSISYVQTAVDAGQPLQYGARHPVPLLVRVVRVGRAGEEDRLAGEALLAQRLVAALHVQNAPQGSACPVKRLMKLA